MKAILAALTVALSLSSAHASDAEGCKDSPLVTRFPGSTIRACTDSADDAVSMPHQNPLEGEVHWTAYRMPAGASQAEVYRNLKTALEKAGFSIPWEHSSSGDFLAHSGKKWISEEVGSSEYKQTVALEIPLAQVVTANANGKYAPMTIAPSSPAGVDAAGCKDSPLITRFPKSVLTDCDDKADDRVSLPAAAESKALEGEVHKSNYAFPKAASKVQVYRNLKTALQAAGFTVAYDGSATGILLGHAGKNWVLEELAESSHVYRQTVVVETELTQEITANADALYGDLAKNGHAAVYGILFDTGKADLKASSAAALEQIVKLLKKEPTLKVYVVGHTDDVGSVASNLDLSRRRAAAVVHALVTDYGIAPNILDSFGAGPYAPVASNDKEPGGRALNRRVELVKQ